ncbi:MAG: hypothetical protein RIT30_1286 [Bacteroidota bacterium]|jgi:phage gpG-like protein
MITIDAFKRDLKQAIKSVPKVMGTASENFFKDNFKRQGFSGESAWIKRKDSDFLTKKKRESGILIKTGSLRRSIRIIEKTANGVRVGSTLPYAEIHNNGGTIIQKPTWRQRMFFSHQSDKLRLLGNHKAANKWAAMSTAKRLVIPIPQRKFIGDSKRLQAHIKYVLERELFESLK